MNNDTPKQPSESDPEFTCEKGNELAAQHTKSPRIKGSFIIGAREEDRKLGENKPGDTPAANQTA